MTRDRDTLGFPEAIEALRARGITHVQTAAGWVGLEDWNPYGAPHLLAYLVRDGEVEVLSDKQARHNSHGEAWATSTGLRARKKSSLDQPEMPLDPPEEEKETAPPAEPDYRPTAPTPAPRKLPRKFKARVYHDARCAACGTSYSWAWIKDEKDYSLCGDCARAEGRPTPPEPPEPGEEDPEALTRDLLDAEDRDAAERTAKEVEDDPYLAGMLAGDDLTHLGHVGSGQNRALCNGEALSYCVPISLAEARNEQTRPKNVCLVCLTVMEDSEADAQEASETPAPEEGATTPATPATPATERPQRARKRQERAPLKRARRRKP